MSEDRGADSTELGTRNSGSIAEPVEPHRARQGSFCSAVKEVRRGVDKGTYLSFDEVGVAKSFGVSERTLP